MNRLCHRDAAFGIGVGVVLHSVLRARLRSEGFGRAVREPLGEAGVAGGVVLESINRFVEGGWRWRLER